MRLALASLLLALAAPPIALACSCSSYEPVKACQIYHSTPVMFRGRVIDHNHDPTSGFGQITLYRFKVVESFKGIPPRTNEVFIDPASLTSCYRQFALDEDYLIYAGSGGSIAAPTTSDRASQQPGGKHLPTAWKDLKDVPVFVVGVCSPTRTIKDDDPDLSYLRDAASGRLATSGWIEGRVVQNAAWPFLFREFVAAPGATVTILAPPGQHRPEMVLQDGTFKTGPIAPGAYTISADSPVLGKAQLRDPTVTVPPGGCVVANASFENKSAITGRVLYHDGTPAAKIDVAAGEVAPDGGLRRIPLAWSTSGADGQFRIPNVPFGRIVLAANLKGAPTEKMPFDPFYAPGVGDSTAARIFEVKPGQEAQAGTLRLPPPLPFGDLHVEVRWPDGSPARGGARAFAVFNGARAAFEQAPRASNNVRLRLALGRTYLITADWLDTSERRFLHVEGGKGLTVDFTQDGQTVEVRLPTLRPREGSNR